MPKNNKSERYCRLCGLDHGNGVVRDKYGCPTHEICECCGIEFGYQDFGDIEDPKLIQHLEKLRNSWIYEQNMQWFDSKFKPNDWNIKNQLANIGIKWK